MSVEGMVPSNRTVSATPSSAARFCSSSTCSGRPPAITSTAGAWRSATIDSSRSGTPW